MIRGWKKGSHVRPVRKVLRPTEELQILRARVQALKAHVDLLDRRIRQIEGLPPVTKFVAVVDSTKCLGCGICETVCPVGAIAINKTARMNSARCIGCGMCVDACQQRAIMLRPLSAGSARREGSQL